MIGAWDLALLTWSFLIEVKLARVHTGNCWGTSYMVRWERDEGGIERGREVEVEGEGRVVSLKDGGKEMEEDGMGRKKCAKFSLVVQILNAQRHLLLLCVVI